MRCFKNIAELIKAKRLQHPKSYSQSELSNLLGYKNGQFISNVERALCNIPLKMLSKVANVLNIEPEELKEAILKDQEETLNNFLKLSSKTTVGAEVTSLRTSANQEAMTSPAANFSSDTYKMSSNS
jgi:transcriptional regulator with XRE-family HTH domain